MERSLVVCHAVIAFTEIASLNGYPEKTSVHIAVKEYAKKNSSSSIILKPIRAHIFRDIWTPFHQARKITIYADAINSCVKNEHNDSAYCHTGNIDSVNFFQSFNFILHFQFADYWILLSLFKSFNPIIHDLQLFFSQIIN